LGGGEYMVPESVKKWEDGGVRRKKVQRSTGGA